MTKKEFVGKLLAIKSEWERLAEEDPTAYHRAIVMEVAEDEDYAYVEAIYEGRPGSIEEYTLTVRLTDGVYRIHVLGEEGYVSPIDDIRDVIYKHELVCSYSIV